LRVELAHPEENGLFNSFFSLQTLKGHTSNVSSVAFHPELPIILTGSEDGTVKIWHATTYRLETSISYGMEHVWAIGVTRGINAVAAGHDEGVVLINMGNEEPVVSMDGSGRIIFAQHNDIQTAVIKALGADYTVVDGERLPLPVKVRSACYHAGGN
jgi:coatomer subunit beta'